MNGPFIPRREPGPDLSCLHQYNEWLACRHESSLLPMKEDLATWLNRILGFLFLLWFPYAVASCIPPPQASYSSFTMMPFIRRVIRWRPDAASGSFFARDNTANFLYWCRKIGVEQSHLFESEDLVLQKHPRDVCLCLMQLARIASRYGIEPPALVKLEKEIEKEEDESLSPSMFFASPLPSPSTPPVFFPPDPEPPPVSIPSSISPPPDPSPSPPLAPTPPPESTSIFTDPNTQSEPQQTSPTPPSPIRTPVKSTPPSQSNSLVKTSGKKSSGNLLDEIVRRISEDPPCKCPVKFCIEKQPKGHYRVGDKVLYVRMLNDKHAMVRVGGGWETFGTYLLKHDPCKMTEIARPGTKTCKPNGRSPVKRELSRDSYLVVGTHSRFKK
ncbi:Growth arrest-specific protein 2 [Labeo rohita]|uniref:Growth arrest-specific protein 2 n=1 Tax=Labeo rohita TaxID=84645 RepID=A0ABQ8MIC7_LABRO|nr:Growth arrest-specific protein 2 [Labeo rohita]